MRTIDKRQEPPELQQYRLKPDACYDGPSFTQIKNKIREQLLQEQGHLCAYCMQRIRSQTMTVEHWHCQRYHPDEQLDYRNLLAVCRGNQGQPAPEQTCGTRKGDKNLHYNPADPSHDLGSRVQYLGDGTIESREKDFDHQLDQLLNLNWARLKQNRKAVIEAVIKGLKKRPGARSQAEIQRLQNKWATPNVDGELCEYCGVAVYLLKKRLKRQLPAKR